MCRTHFSKIKLKWQRKSVWRSILRGTYFADVPLATSIMEGKKMMLWLYWKQYKVLPMASVAFKQKGESSVIFKIFLKHKITAVTIVNICYTRHSSKTLNSLPHLIFIILHHGYYYYPYFKDEETKIQRSEATCQKSQRMTVVEPERRIKTCRYVYVYLEGEGRGI